MIELLDAVWRWYVYVCDSITVAAHLVETEPEIIPASVVFALDAPGIALDALDQTRDEIEGLTVLALFAVFERSILDHLDSTREKVQQGLSSPLEEALVSKGLEDIERWRLGEILDVYKIIIDSHLVGLVKQVKDYRDWIAHGKKKSMPTRIDPKTAYDRLSDFLRALQD